MLRCILQKQIMAYYAVGDPEALVECPYDKTHMVRNKRMQYHLIDCRKVSSLSQLVEEYSCYVGLDL